MLTDERRERAERFLAGRVRPLVCNPQVRPHWLGDRFWFRRETADGITFTLVDGATGNQSPAFDHAATAALLSRVTGTPVSPGALPIADFDGQSVQLHDGRRVRLSDGDITPAPAPLRPGETASPDGRRAVFCRDHNLWLRTGHTEQRLTETGAVHHAWAKSPDMNLTTVTLQQRGIKLPANVLWSPDGVKLFTSQLDERAVLDFPLVQHVPGGPRPVVHSMKFALSGDAALPLESHAIIDLGTGAVTLAPSGPHVTGMTTCLEKEEAWWSADSSRVYFLDRDRYWRRLTLFELIAATGAVREVYSETVPTFIDTNLSVLGLPNIRVLDTRGEFIWFSQEDGWAHLYLHDLATGQRKNRITSGAWAVRDIAHVDPENGFVEFLAGGMVEHPYHRTLCRAALDGSGLTVLTPGGNDQALAIPLKRVPRDHIRPPGETGAYRAPSGRFFVHTPF